MPYQEQFELIFTRIYSSFSERFIYVCKCEGLSEQSVVLRDLLGSVTLADIEDVFLKIGRIKDGIIPGDDLAFDGTDSELFLDPNVAILGGIEFSLIEFEGVLLEWIEYCKK